MRIVGQGRRRAARPWMPVVGALLLATTAGGESPPGKGEADTGGATAEPAVVETADEQLPVEVLHAAPLTESGRALVVGHFGLLGYMDTAKGGLKLEILPTKLDVDFIAAHAIGPRSVLVGTSTGRVHAFEDGELGEGMQVLPESEDPVLDLASSEGRVWAVGGRGLVARSTDGAESWEPRQPERVRQPPLELPSTEPGTWYTGVANVRPESVEFRGYVDGREAKEGEDYRFRTEDGVLEVTSALDASPTPTIGFEFAPGAPYQAGDVTWNVVLLDEDDVTIAGEFGLVLQTDDEGETWERRFGSLTPEEPQQPYWMVGDREGDRLVLAGGAGLIARSRDGGRTWESLPTPSPEAIFGVRLLGEDAILAVGAVGFAGRFSGGEWTLADRTRLNLTSWLKTFVPSLEGVEGEGAERDPDDYLILGGRTTAIRFDGSQWSKTNIQLP